MSNKSLSSSIDYSPLNNLYKRDIWSPRVATLSIILGTLLLVILGAFVQNRAKYLVFFVYFGFSVYFLYTADRAAKKNEFFLREFALVNGWKFTSTNKPTLKPGSIFSVGHSQNTLNTIDGEILNSPFSLYTFIYATGYGKSRKEFDLQVFELTLPRKLPHMVIDSLVESGNGQASTLPIKFDKYQKIELEGDFSKYFSLYAPDNYGITALTVLAPDAMEILMKYAATCDIEIINNKLYFYWPEPIKTKKDYQKVFSSVEHILDEILDKLKTSDIYATEDQAALHASAATKGARLKQNHHLIPYTFLIVFLAAYLGSLLQRESERGETISLMLFPVATLLLIATMLYSIFIQVERARRKHMLNKRFKD